MSKYAEPSIKLSPSSIARTPQIIGLRTCRYGPTTTSRRVRSQGASVPSPKRANSRTHLAVRRKPPSQSTTPTPQKRRAAGESSGQRTYHPRPAQTIKAGTTTTTTNGRARIARRCLIMIIVPGPQGNVHRRHNLLVLELELRVARPWLEPSRTPEEQADFATSDQDAGSGPANSGTP